MTGSNPFQLGLATVAMWMLTQATPLMAQTKDHAPVALSSASKMAHDDPMSESWTYMKPGLDLTNIRSVVVEPTAVYAGPDAQFDGIASDDRSRFAEILTTALQTEIAKSFPASGFPPAQTLKIRVTLLGATPTKGGFATATRASSVGFALSALKSVRGKPGSLTGSLLYAIEVLQGPSSEIVVAAVRRRHPDALDIPATVSTTATVKAVARDFASTLRGRLEDATKR